MKKWLLLLTLYTCCSDQEAPVPEEFEFDSQEELEQVFESNESFFSKKEYDYLIELIKEIDPKMHALLVECSSELGEPCLQKTYNFEASLKEPDNPTKLRPVLILPVALLQYPREKQKDHLKRYVQLYPYTSPMQAIERQIILKAIQSIAPELYNAIIAVDFSGKHHIKRYYKYNLVIYASAHDGLPIIYVGDGILEHLSFDQIKAFVAHELGHYVSGHILRSAAPFIHRTFENAQARIREYEADRAQVLDFNIPIEIARQAGNFFLSNSSESALTDTQRSKRTFTRTHPFWLDRFNHFESLRSEVHLKKARGQGRAIFDWQKLAQQHMAQINR